MIIEKKYHFYAAHRNEALQDKCRNIHGHTYYVTVYIDLGNPGANGVTILFSEIDKIIEPIIKYYDHKFLVHTRDKFLRYLHQFGKDYPFEALSFVVFHEPTSAENLAKILFQQIKNELPFTTELHLQETTTSKVIYKPEI